MALSAIIADDESPARNKMVRLLNDIEDVEVVFVAANGLEAFNAILEHKPDVAFLDIEMPGMNGLDVVEQLEMEDMPQIVFATAYNEHAIKAFDLDAVDYLLKPFNAERLQQAIDKIQARLEAEDTEDVDSDGDEDRKLTAKEKAKKVAAELSPHKLEKIPVPTADRYKLLNFDEVVCIEVEDRTTNIHTLSKVYPINMTLEAFERKLPSDRFLRVSRSAIINIHAIEEVVLWFGNRYKIILNNGKDVVSSRERSKTLKKMLKF